MVRRQVITMPELPEVETVKNLLKTFLIDRKIISIDVLREGTIIGSPTVFSSTLKGLKFIDITRKGKFLIFHLSENKVILSHLRMEGKFFELDEKEQNTHYSRVVFHLDNGHKLCYDDSRCFGFLKLTNEDNYLKEKEIAKLGLEPSEVIDIDDVFCKVKDSNHPIKELITDQSIIAGIGNIYADEILYACKLHPLTPGRFVTRDNCIDIIENAKKILAEAIKQGGSTIKSYHPGKDLDGKFQGKLLAYGKAGEKCPRCGAEYVFIKVNGRGTTYCPKCQKKKGAPVRVAIFGKIASGKSEVLKHFAKIGYPTISSDEIVSSLYKEKEIANTIAKMFSLPFKNEVDKSILREYLVSHPKDIVRINRYIHPLVKERIELFFKANKDRDIVVVEVPLLFESKSENMFDYIIGVDSKEDIQLDRLANRNKQDSKSLRKIAMNNRFEENKNKADIIIDNNSDLASLDSQIDKIVSKLQEYLDLFPSLHLL